MRNLRFLFLISSLDLEHDTSARNCRLLALIKRVHVLLQTKMQMGKQPDNDDLAAAKESVIQAKKLSPKHEMVEQCPFYYPHKNPCRL